jgi:hypothetical protein
MKAFSMGLTLNETPNTSDEFTANLPGLSFKSEKPMGLSFHPGLNLDDIDLEERENTIQFCPAPMTSRGDNCSSILAHCLTPCYGPKTLLRQNTVKQEDQCNGGQRHGFCIRKTEHRSTQEDRVSTTIVYSNHVMLF